jgi:hypothetical protein
MRRVCLCIAVTVTVNDWAHGFVCNTGVQHTTLLARRRVRPRAHCSCMAARIAVVAAESNEATAAALGQRLGGAVFSLADVMKGRKGRKTDKVKATAVYEAITAAAADNNWVLTGFPENALQGTLFQKLGGSFDHLIVVQPAAAAAANEAVLELVEQYKDITVEIATDTPEIMAAGVLHVLEGTGSTLTTTTTDVSTDAATDTASSSTVVAREHAQTSESPETSNQHDSTAAAAINRQSKRALKASSNSKDTTTAPTAAKLFDAESSDAIAVPWYAAVAKTTSKSGNKKSAVTTAALALAAAADATPSKIVQTLGAAQSSISTDSSISNSSGKSKEVKAQAAAVSSTMFGDIELDLKSAECLVKAGITEPTPIQSAAMARIAAGKHYRYR